MTNPPSPDAPRQVRNTPPMGEAFISAVPKMRILAWVLVGLVTIAGVVLYFMYGDFVAPILV